LHQYPVAVFFDLEMAYDKTWHYGFLRTLHQWCQFHCSYQAFSRIISSMFISAMFFCSITRRKRTVTMICYPVHYHNQWDDQCSWSINLNISICWWKCTLLQFPSTVIAECHLKITISHLLHWALQRVFISSTAKTQFVHFTWLKGLHCPPNLFNNSTLLFAPAVEFLGLLVENKHSWKLKLRQLLGEITLLTF
jgi:hypothetical protein